MLAPLTGCDMLLGTPWLESHHPVLNSRTATFYILDCLPTPTTMVCDRRLPSIPLISHVQAHRALRKGAECALIYVRSCPMIGTSSSLLPSGHSSASANLEGHTMEPRMKALVDKYKHLMLKDGLPP